MQAAAPSLLQQPSLALPPPLQCQTCRGRCGELRYALEHCMVRHTKRQQVGGEAVLALPAKRQEDVPGKRALAAAVV